MGQNKKRGDIMANFMKQITEDIKEIQQNNPFTDNIDKDEWAFNYWVLDKLFFIDDELIEQQIVDYKDLGVDCYVFYEETKELYLIQNKFYSDTTKIQAEYVKNDFVLRPINALKQGTYSRCEELQDIYNKYSSDPEFMVFSELYITNNLKNEKAEEFTGKYSEDNPGHMVSIYYLDDIEEKYFGEIKKNKTNLEVEVASVNKGTILQINNEQYRLRNVIDARYVFTPVFAVYKLYKDAREQNYPIFDQNIREYLGNNKINKNIYKTLLDEDERKNFFYYNNGITVICDKMDSVKTRSTGNNLNAYFRIKNPQIVNGCQTVNSIYEALSKVNPSKLSEEFKDCFVMLKILEINREDDGEGDLYKDIVRYTNSQNAIKESTFVAIRSEFLRLQTEFERKGFLLLIKQSDKHTFTKKYRTIAELKSINSERFKRFGINEASKLSDCYIDLVKLLQVIIAFEKGAYYAYTKKSNLLKIGTDEFERVLNFIKNPELTIDMLLDLYLLYKRAEIEKKKSESGNNPIVYYLIDGFAKYENNGRKIPMLGENLNSLEKINKTISLYKGVTKMYSVESVNEEGIEYNKMIKRQVNYTRLEKLRNTAKVMI